MNLRSAVAALALLLAALAGSGCVLREEIFSSLGEREANEMVAILRFNGYDARKLSKGKDGFAVAVPNDDFANSVKLLHSWGYPREEKVNIGDLFQSGGIVPTQSEARIRCVHGVARELTETLAHLEGIMENRVHIALGNIEGNSQGENNANTASVFILFDPERADLESLMPMIRQLVGSSLPGLEPERVQVLSQPGVSFEFGRGLTNPRQEVVLAGVRLRPQDFASVLTVFAGLAVLDLALLIALLAGLARGARAA
ncbi:MAG: hypothetical protein OXC81_07195 [Betaproteobacteria bacterium]|nr:hypothetical protein [Betaproteobacteria bacterium]